MDSSVPPLHPTLPTTLAPPLSADGHPAPRAAGRTRVTAARHPGARVGGRRRALGRALGGTAVAALFALSAATVTAAPALAHDQLLSTTPEAGSTVTSTPAEVSLTFSGNLITGQGIQNLVTVTDEAGHQWQDGDAQVAGPELTSALCEGMPNGDYEVGYRVVYSDGHSEAEQYGFTLDDPAAPDTAVPQDCGVPNPDAPVSSEQPPTPARTGVSDGATEPAAQATDPADGPTTETTSDAAEATEAAGGIPAWVWGVGVLGVLVVAAAMVLVYRRAKAIDGPAGGKPGSEG